MTLLPRSGAPDDGCDQVEREFSPDKVVALTLAIVATSGWNRFVAGLRPSMGSDERRET